MQAGAATQSAFPEPRNTSNTLLDSLTDDFEVLFDLDSPSLDSSSGYCSSLDVVRQLRLTVADLQAKNTHMNKLFGDILAKYSSDAAGKGADSDGAGHLENEVERIAKLLKDKDTEIRVMRLEKVKCGATSENLQNGLLQLKEEKQELSENLADKCKQLDEMSIKLATLVQQHQQLSTYVASFEGANSLEPLRQELELCKDEIDSKNTKIKNLEGNLGKLMREKPKGKKMDAQVQANTDECGSTACKRNLDALRDKHESLEQECSLLERKNKTLLEDFSRKKEELNSKRALIFTLQDQVDSLERHKVNYNEYVKQAEQRHSSKDQEISDLYLKIQKISQDLQNSERHVKELEHELSGFQSQDPPYDQLQALYASELQRKEQEMHNYYNNFYALQYQEYSAQLNAHAHQQHLARLPH